MNEYINKLRKKTNEITKKVTFTTKINENILLVYTILKLIWDSLAIIIFWYQTYYYEDIGLMLIDLLVYAIFGIEATLKFIYHPKPKCMFFFKFDNIIDFASVVLEYVIVITKINNGIGVGFLRIFKIMNIITTLDAIKLYLRSCKGK